MALTKPLLGFRTVSFYFVDIENSFCSLIDFYIGYKQVMEFVMMIIKMIIF